MIGNWSSKSLMVTMKFTYWIYARPAHVGTLRVASSFKNVHAIMHAPLGDEHFNVMHMSCTCLKTLMPSRCTSESILNID